MLEYAKLIWIFQLFIHVGPENEVLYIRCNSDVQCNCKTQLIWHLRNYRYIHKYTYCPVLYSGRRASTFGLFGVTISTYTVHNYIYILHYSITYSELNFKKEIEKLEYSEINLHSTGEMINGNSAQNIPCTSLLV